MTMRLLADAWEMSILDTWQRFALLCGDEPTVNERKLARLAAESCAADVVIAKAYSDGTLP